MNSKETCLFTRKSRACLPFVFAMKNEKNRPFFKEKVKFDSYSIKQAFDDEKQSDHLIR
ncbi:Uncharacterised protein [Moraxella lacunata]|uniref:Uncharacterized protein n=1 Tax=Moraxella lacunata TaxID=477 RepID=A0A378QG18_MORLA|nr:Uncharacterised protein [Moraxella lacunata]